MNEQDIIKVEYVNDVHMRVTADPGIRQEIMNYFSFRPPGYQFTPAYKNRIWDGWIRIYNPMKPFLYVGLLNYLQIFASEREYLLEIDNELKTKEPQYDETYLNDLLKTLNCKLIPRDYQIQYVLNAINNDRSLSLSPTSSGKSFIQYLIQQHYFQQYGHKTLIVVPTIGLVHQMFGDFVDYGCDASLIYKIQGGIDKTETTLYEFTLENDDVISCYTNETLKILVNGKSTKKLARFIAIDDILDDKTVEQSNNRIKSIRLIEPTIFISTWQSIAKMNKEWFDQFKVVLGDEAHLFQAKSLQSIMEKLTDTPYRHGFTGTISSDSKVHKLILEGVFGPIKRFISTKDLIDEGTVADFKVKALILKYPDETKKSFAMAIKKVEPTKRYSMEREFLFANEKRNLFIRNLVWSLKNQNNLILFDQIENQGERLKELLPIEDRILFYVHGGTDGIERDKIRSIIENDPLKRYDILASSGVFSTGVNIKRLDNAIFTAAGKSEIKILQSIGRTLRKGNGSDHATLYDITDDLSKNSYINYTLKHFRTRIELYSKEQFPFKLYNIDL